MKRALSKRWQGLLRLIPGYDPFASTAGCEFDADAAQLAIDFFPTCLTHIEGKMAGKPFELEPWQQSIVANLFGWKRQDGSRRYRELFLFVPRKNGKTPFAAGVANYVLFCDDEAGQQNICAAGDTDQASLLFRQAAWMVKNDPELSKRAEIYGLKGGSVTRSVVVPSTRSVMRVISAVADTKHGGNLHLGLIDELHVQPNRELVDVIQTSMASANRRQPLLVEITTSDFDRESICNEKHEYAGKVRDGVIDDPYFLPVIYEAKPDDDWTDPKVWAKANPNLGVSVSLEYLDREAKRAKETPGYQNTFKRLHLNIRTRQETLAIDMDRWDACGGEVDAEVLAGRRCFAGLDLSSKQDFTALALVFPPTDEDPLTRVLPWFWYPEETAAQVERANGLPVKTWATQGLVTLTEGNTVDLERVFADVCEIVQRYDVQEVVADPWNAKHMMDKLAAFGVTVVEFHPVVSHFSLPTKELLDLIARGELAHGDNPVLRYMAACLATKTDANQNIRPVKPDRKTGKRIDGIVATIMGLSRALVAQPAGFAWSMT